MRHVLLSLRELYIIRYGEQKWASFGDISNPALPGLAHGLFPVAGRIRCSAFPEDTGVGVRPFPGPPPVSGAQAQPAGRGGVFCLRRSLQDPQF